MTALTVDQYTALMDASRLAGEQHFTAYPDDASEPLDDSSIKMLAAGLLRFYDGNVPENTDLNQYIDDVAQELRKAFVHAGGLVV